MSDPDFETLAEHRPTPITASETPQGKSLAAAVPVSTIEAVLQVVVEAEKARANIERNFGNDWKN